MDFRLIFDGFGDRFLICFISFWKSVVSISMSMKVWLGNEKRRVFV